MLQSAGVTVDSLLIGGSSNAPLKAISIATGGSWSQPSSITEALQVLEADGMISLDDRDPASLIPKPDITSNQQLLSLVSGTTGSVSVQPTYTAPRITGTASTMSAVLARATTTTTTPSTTTSGGLAGCHRRVVKELSDLAATPLSYAHIYPSEDDITSWRVLIEGPADTPYAGGLFLLSISFAQEYPFKRPTIQFMTPIYHPGVSTSGKSCNSDVWSPAVTMRSMLEKIHAGIGTPKAEDAIDSQKAEEFRIDRLTFDTKAAAFTKLHASKTLAEYRMEFGVDDEPDTVTPTGPDATAPAAPTTTTTDTTAPPAPLPAP